LLELENKEKERGWSAVRCGASEAKVKKKEKSRKKRGKVLIYKSLKLDVASTP